MPVYELFCLAKPQLAKEHIASLIKTACLSVFSNNGVLTEVLSYDVRDLAYPIRKAGSKYEQAKMWQMQFLVKPEVLPEIHRNLHVNEDVLRWIVTKRRQHPVMPNTHSVAKAAQRSLTRQGLAPTSSAEQHVAPH